MQLYVYCVVQHCDISSPVLKPDSKATHGTAVKAQMSQRLAVLGARGGGGENRKTS